ncbi:hypothetical protein [Clostridium tertium]|uniref:hypothetical protein n=1 Tax=Clostridium tertium TaxID=1559 RepID=UPI0023B347DE|nr:hypothetical protein [Clostridium tertium]
MNTTKALKQEDLCTRKLSLSLLCLIYLLAAVTILITGGEGPQLLVMLLSLMYMLNLYLGKEWRYEYITGYYNMELTSVAEPNKDLNMTSIILKIKYDINDNKLKACTIHENGFILGAATIDCDYISKGDSGKVACNLRSKVQLSELLPIEGFMMLKWNRKSNKNKIMNMNGILEHEALGYKMHVNLTRMNKKQLSEYTKNI